MVKHDSLPEVINLAQAMADDAGIEHYITPVDGGGWLVSPYEADGSEPFIVIKPSHLRLGLSDGRF